MVSNNPAHLPVLPGQWTLHVCRINLKHLLKMYTCAEKWLFSGRAFCIASNKKNQTYTGFRFKKRKQNKIPH